MNPLSFLRNQRAVGRYESEGHFTLGAEAARKLANYALPEPSFWILKIVQAAVACGAPSINVRQGNVATIITFECNQEFDPRQVRKALVSADVEAGPAEAYLVAGLRAVGVGGGRSFSIEFHREKAREAVIWDGEHLSVHNSQSGWKGCQKIELGVLWSSPDPGPLVNEYRALIERAYTCPVELKVGGRRVDSLVPEIPSNKKRETASFLSDGADYICPIILGTGVSDSHLLKPMRVSASVARDGKSWGITNRFTASRPLHVVGKKAATCTHLWRLDYSFQVKDWGLIDGAKFEFKAGSRESKVHWLLDGVLIQSDNLGVTHPGVSLELFLNAEDLQLDLSGFALSEKSRDVRRARVEAAMSNFSEQVELARRKVGTVVPVPFAGGLAPALGIISACGAFMFKFIFLHIGLAAYLGLKSAKHKRRVLNDCQKRLETFRGVISQRFS